MCPYEHVTQAIKIKSGSKGLKGKTRNRKRGGQRQQALTPTLADCRLLSQEMELTQGRMSMSVLFVSWGAGVSCHVMSN